MLRPLGLACLSASLAACASLLGDFDVVADSPDAAVGGVDGSVTETGLTDGGDAGAQPVPVEVAVNQFATCATVRYGTTLKSYCWGAEDVKLKEYLGVSATDQPVGGFYVPRVPGGAPLVLDKIYGTGKGAWFIASGTQSQGATTAFTWGSNLFSQSGQNTPSTTANVLPAELTATSGGSTGKLRAPVAAGGTQHGCLIDDEKLYCWGKNESCQVTGGTLASCGAPLPPASPQLSPVEVSPSGKRLTYDRVAAGFAHTCVIARAGAGDKDVYCFGDNTSGQCGRDKATTAVGAAQIPTGVDVKASPNAEIAAGEKHTCVLLRNKVMCWGANDQFQADPKSTDKLKAPTEVDLGVTGSLSLLTLAGNATCVVAGNVTGKSRALCFGSGELGREANTPPVAPVSGIEDIKRLALSNKHGCAIASATGSSEVGLYCWGLNDAKAVDPNATEPRFPTPHRVLFPAQ